MKKTGAMLLCAAIILTSAFAFGQSKAPKKAKVQGAATALAVKRDPLVRRADGAIDACIW